MTDPISAAALGAAGKSVDATAAEAAKTAGNLLTRLLGPSADVIGADWASKIRQKNLARLLAKTQKRAEGSSDPGFATPRLAAAAFEAAQYAEDEIVAEYLSGVLASSREPGGGDDAGIAWSALIARLSTDQLRLHFLIYASIREAVIASKPASVSTIHNVDMLLSMDELWQRLGLLDAGLRGPARFADAVDGLMREDLIGDSYAYGAGEYLEENGRKYGEHLRFAATNGLMVQATVHGVRLFLWGMGLGLGQITQYIDPTVKVNLADEEIALTPVEPAGLSAQFWTQPNAENPLA